MTKIKQHKVICSNCGHVFPAMVVYSTNSFMPKPSEEQLEKTRAVEEKNGTCPQCGTKNEVSPTSPVWENE